jgi:hypothetical protein
MVHRVSSKKRKRHGAHDATSLQGVSEHYPEFHEKLCQFPLVAGLFLERIGVAKAFAFKVYRVIWPRCIRIDLIASSVTRQQSRSSVGLDDCLKVALGLP